MKAVIPKLGFKRKLGDSRKEALAAYAQHHAEVARAIAAAKREKARFVAGSTAREAYAEALRRRVDLIAAGSAQAALEREGDGIADKASSR